MQKICGRLGTRQRPPCGRPSRGTWKTCLNARSEDVTDLPKGRRKQTVDLPESAVDALKAHRHLRGRFVYCPGGAFNIKLDISVMTTKELVKYYDGFMVEGGHEVTAEEARGLPSHAKAFFSAPGTLERTELYSREALFQVDYPGERRSDDDIKTFHLKTYARVGFAARRKLSSIHGFIWEDVHSYSASGELEGFTLILQRQNGPGLMEVNLELLTKIRFEIPEKYQAAAQHKEAKVDIVAPLMARQR
ncbi:uncharacterized protein STAUR_6152 [Stigmatella aurantiaca DW4/3-1]|nr:uncharacterized protein STAUR_6152 [Stigmatella aurantiaca DW4/3-1]